MEAFSNETIKRLEDAIRYVDGDHLVIHVSKDNLKKAVEIFRYYAAIEEKRIMAWRYIEQFEEESDEL